MQALNLGLMVAVPIQFRRTSVGGRVTKPIPDALVRTGRRGKAPADIWRESGFNLVQRNCQQAHANPAASALHGSLRRLGRCVSPRRLSALVIFLARHMAIVVGIAFGKMTCKPRIMLRALVRHIALATGQSVEVPRGT